MAYERADVTLFRRGGKYYTDESWRIPGNAIGPFDMNRSPDFRRIDGGAVLVHTQEPWGYPHLFPSAEIPAPSGSHAPTSGDHINLDVTCPACGATWKPASVSGWEFVHQPGCAG